MTREPGHQKESITGQIFTSCLKIRTCKVHVEGMIMAVGRRVYVSETFELKGQQIERQIGPSSSCVWIHEADISCC